MKRYNIIILGGGAAGLFLSGYLDKRYNALIIEGNDRLGAKLAITGGGRCNFTNTDISHNDYRSSNPHFVKSALARFTPYDFIGLIEKHRINYEERDGGKLFAYSSNEIINMLADRCNADIKISHKILNAEKADNVFRVTTDKEVFESDILIIATGGVSFPKIGATDVGLKIAAKFGHMIVKPKPALTPLKYPSDNKDFSCLSGISLRASITIKKHIYTDQLLFTHEGFSGPLALLASIDYEEGDEIIINFAPDIDFDKFIADARVSKKSLTTLLSYHIPKSLAKLLFASNEPDMTKLRASERDMISETVREFRCKPSGTEGFDKAEVMAGGVSVDKIASSTMESKLVENLYIIGEAADVTGKLGGYNLHWAWASANACGLAISDKLKGGD